MNFSLSDYTNYLIQFISDIDRDYIEESKLKSNIEKEYNFILSRLENQQRAAKFREHCFIGQTRIEDYCLKKIQFENFYLISGIRFEGLDISKPFIEIEYYNIDVIQFIKQIPEIKKKLIEEYNVFNCDKICLLMSDNYLDLYNFKLEKPIYSSKLSDIYDRPKIDFNFKLEKIEEFSERDYEVYLREYEIFHQENPNLIHITAEPLEVIREKAKSDFVFKIFQNNQWIGLVIYVYSTEYFFYGYLVWDKIIFHKYRGQKMSSLAQDLAFKEFIPKQNGFIFGYIDPLNHSSIRSAISSGRKLLLGIYMI